MFNANIINKELWIKNKLILRNSNNQRQLRQKQLSTKP